MINIEKFQRNEQLEKSICFVKFSYLSQASAYRISELWLIVDKIYIDISVLKGDPSFPYSIVISLSID